MSTLLPSSSEQHEVDFREALEFARRADLAYLSDAEIRACYPGRRVVVEDLAASEVRYFIVFDDGARTQDISVRGTSNLENVKVDAELSPQPDPVLNVHLHSGFARASKELVQGLSRHLRDDYRTTITGHSLGGAVAAITGMYLEAGGYPLTAIRTFGQPKVTNLAGARKMQDLPIIRFVNGTDPVADVPPLLSVTDTNWLYTHFGPEVMLWTGNRYIYLEKHQALGTAVVSFWSNLGDHVVTEHQMAQYLGALERQQEQSVEIRFEERDSFR